MFTLTILGLCLFIGPGLVVLAVEHLCSGIGREHYTISTRELPNVAADLGAPDTEKARR